MQKLFVLIATIFIAAAAASAQTVAERKPLPESKQVAYAKRVENGRAAAPTVETVVSAKTNKEAKRGGAINKRDPRVLRLGPSTTYLKNGLSAEEVVRLLGKPTSLVEQREGNSRFSTYTFERSEGRILIAEFENGVLVASRMQVAEKLAQRQEAKQ